MNINEIKPGQAVLCNGYPGTVTRITANGMVEVRLERGEVCVDAGEVSPVPPGHACPAGEHTPRPLFVRDHASNGYEYFTLEKEAFGFRSVLARCHPDELCPEHGGNAESNALLFASAPDLLAENSRLRGIVQLCSHFISRAHGGEGMTDDERWALISDADAECRAALAEGGGL